MSKQNDTRQVVGAKWLGTHTIHGVPARDLNEVEWSNFEKTIVAHESTLGQKIYERVYAQGSN